MQQLNFDFMADKNTPPKASSDNKSGVSNKEYLTQLGGLPERKNVEQIDKVNMPKNAPGSVRA